MKKFILIWKLKHSIKIFNLVPIVQSWISIRHTRQEIIRKRFNFKVSMKNIKNIFWDAFIKKWLMNIFSLLSLGCFLEFIGSALFANIFVLLHLIHISIRKLSSSNLLIFLRKGWGDFYTPKRHYFLVVIIASSSIKL